MGNQQGLSKNKINKTIKKVESQLQASVDQAEQLAADNGISLDLNKVFNNFKAAYGDQIQKTADSLLNQGKDVYNNNRDKVTDLQNNPDVKKVQNTVKNIGFQQLLNQAASELTKQVNKVGNAKLKNNLKNLINNGKQQASKTLKKKWTHRKNLEKSRTRIQEKRR